MSMSIYVTAKAAGGERKAGDGREHGSAGTPSYRTSIDPSSTKSPSPGLSSPTPLGASLQPHPQHLQCQPHRLPPVTGIRFAPALALLFFGPACILVDSRRPP